MATAAIEAARAVPDFVGGPNCGALYTVSDPPQKLTVVHYTGSGERWLTTYRLVKYPSGRRRYVCLRTVKACP